MEQSKQVKEALKQVSAIVQRSSELSRIEMTEYAITTQEADRRIYISVTAPGGPIDTLFSFLTSSQYVHDYKNGVFGDAHLTKQTPPIPHPAWYGVRNIDPQQPRTIMFEA